MSLDFCAVALTIMVIPSCYVETLSLADQIRSPSCHNGRQQWKAEPGYISSTIGCQHLKATRFALRTRHTALYIRYMQKFYVDIVLLALTSPQPIGTDITQAKTYFCTSSLTAILNNAYTSKQPSLLRHQWWQSANRTYLQSCDLAKHNVNARAKWWHAIVDFHHCSVGCAPFDRMHHRLATIINCLSCLRNFCPWVCKPTIHFSHQRNRKPKKNWKMKKESIY